MKNVIKTFAALFILALTVISLMAIASKSAREEALENALSSAIYGTAEQVYSTKAYTVADEDEFIADFLEAFLVQIDSKCTVTVNVMACDLEKGIFSVEVVENYSYENGNQGSVCARRTCILERPYGEIE